MLGSKQSKYISSVPSENGGNVGLASILEADVKSIVNMARQTYEKYVIFLKFLCGACSFRHFYVFMSCKQYSSEFEA